MGFQVIDKPNSFCKDSCRYMELDAEANKYTTSAGCGEEPSYSAQVYVFCKNERICKMWNNIQI